MASCGHGLGPLPLPSTTSWGLCSQRHNCTHTHRPKGLSLLSPRQNFQLSGRWEWSVRSHLSGEVFTPSPQSPFAPFHLLAHPTPGGRPTKRALAGRGAPKCTPGPAQVPPPGRTAPRGSRAIRKEAAAPRGGRGGLPRPSPGSSAGPPPPPAGLPAPAPGPAPPRPALTCGRRRAARRCRGRGAGTPPRSPSTGPGAPRRATPGAPRPTAPGPGPARRRPGPARWRARAAR